MSKQRNETLADSRSSVSVKTVHAFTATLKVSRNVQGATLYHSEEMSSQAHISNEPGLKQDVRKSFLSVPGSRLA